MKECKCTVSSDRTIRMVGMIDVMINDGDPISRPFYTVASYVYKCDACEGMVLSKNNYRDLRKALKEIGVL